MTAPESFLLKTPSASRAASWMEVIGDLRVAVRSLAKLLALKSADSDADTDLSLSFVFFGVSDRSDLFAALLDSALIRYRRACGRKNSSAPDCYITKKYIDVLGEPWTSLHSHFYNLANKNTAHSANLYESYSCQIFVQQNIGCKDVVGMDMIVARHFDSPNKLRQFHSLIEMLLAEANARLDSELKRCQEEVLALTQEKIETLERAWMAVGPAFGPKRNRI